MSRLPVLQLGLHELVIDSFAGGGGASYGIELALGRSPDVAINHDAEAIALHAANHPTTKHYREDVWKVDPREATGGKPVGLMWLSPDCKHFSKAKGGKPVSKRVRGLAWVAVRWAAAVKPRVIVLENVEEFQSWGPVLRETDKPCPDRKGKHFRSFVRKLERLGYQVQWRELRACDYGAPTIRKRLFLVARCDGMPITWPAATHGKHHATPWRTAAECIDWSIACPSIFTRSKPLAENTLKRIAAGLKRYVIDTGKPFIVSYHSAKRAGDDRTADLFTALPTQTTENRFGLVTPYLVGAGGPARAGEPHGVDRPVRTLLQKNDTAVVAPYLVPRYGERDGQEPRALSADAPMPTVVPTQNGASLVSAFLAKHYGGVVGSQMEMPIGTVTGTDHHSLVTSNLVQFNRNCDGRDLTEPLGTITAHAEKFAEVRAFMVAYYGNEKDGGSLFDPVRTVTSKDRMGLVTVQGVDYAIADIGMRMLAPRELFRAQGFPDSYKIDVPFNGKPMTKTAQVRMCGNSVCPPVAAAIIRAQFGLEAQKERAA